jgi:hypothetical protein
LFLDRAIWLLIIQEFRFPPYKKLTGGLSGRGERGEGEGKRRRERGGRRGEERGEERREEVIPLQVIQKQNEEAFGGNALNELYPNFMEFPFGITLKKIKIFFS